MEKEYFNAFELFEKWAPQLITYFYDPPNRRPVFRCKKLFKASPGVSNSTYRLVGSKIFHFHKPIFFISKSPWSRAKTLFGPRHYSYKGISLYDIIKTFAWRQGMDTISTAVFVIKRIVKWDERFDKLGGNDKYTFVGVQKCGKRSRKHMFKDENWINLRWDWHRQKRHIWNPS